MKLRTQFAIGLAVLAGTTLSGAAQAQNLAVSETTTGPGDFFYTYTVMPTFNTSLLTFSFQDSNISAVSATGPLTNILAASPGNFVNFSVTGGMLNAGSTETVVFRSADAAGGFVNIASDGVGGTGGASSLGPAAVPEASTTISFGLLLMLGLGGFAAARKKRASASA